MGDPSKPAATQRSLRNGPTLKLGFDDFIPDLVRKWQGQRVDVIVENRPTGRDRSLLPQFSKGHAEQFDQPLRRSFFDIHRVVIPLSPAQAARPAGKHVGRFCRLLPWR